MPKLKQPVSKPNSLKDFLSTYPAVTLHGAVSTFEGSVGWELLRSYAAYVQRQYEVNALDLIGKQGLNQQAAYASGYAKACEDMASFADGLRKIILGQGDVYESPRPED